MKTWWKRQWSTIRWCWRAVILFAGHHHMHGYTGIVIGSVMHFRSTSSMLVAILDAIIESGLIVHALRVSDCMVLATFVMFWRNRSRDNESV
jgi:hypothetical protein